MRAEAQQRGDRTVFVMPDDLELSPLRSDNISGKIIFNFAFGAPPTLVRTKSFHLLSQTARLLESPTGAFMPSGHRRPFWFSFGRQKENIPRRPAYIHSIQPFCCIIVFNSVSNRRIFCTSIDFSFCTIYTKSVRRRSDEAHRPGGPKIIQYI